MREGQPSASISGPATCTIASCHGTRAHDPYPLPPKSRWTVCLPKATGLFSHRKDVDQKNLFTKPIWAHSDRRSAHLGSQSQRAVPMRDRPTNYQDSRTQASPGPQSTVGSQPGRHRIKFPRTEYHDSLKNIQLTKNQVFQPYLRRV